MNPTCHLVILWTSTPAYTWDRAAVAAVSLATWQCSVCESNECTVPTPRDSRHRGLCSQDNMPQMTYDIYHRCHRLTPTARCPLLSSSWSSPSSSARIRKSCYAITSAGTCSMRSMNALDKRWMREYKLPLQRNLQCMSALVNSTVNYLSMLSDPN